MDKLSKKEMNMFEAQTKLSALRAHAEEAATAGPDMREPEAPRHPLHLPMLAPWQEAILPEAVKAAQSLSRDQLGQRYGDEVTDAAIAIAQSQATTPQAAFAAYARDTHAAKANLGKALANSGTPVQQHSAEDYERVICTQLDLFRNGGTPSVTAVLVGAFPDNPRKVKSISGSTRKGRWKRAYSADSVRHHPVEVGMQGTHCPADMRRRLAARTFGESLGINSTLYQTGARITALEARVASLEAQMLTTKAREALDDAGATTSKEKVLLLHSQGKGPAEISQVLDMNINTVKSTIRRNG